MNRILVTRSSMPTFEEYTNEIKDLWNSHWLTNMGVKHKQFQSELEQMLGVPHVSLYTNGHLALENAIAAMNFPNTIFVILSGEVNKSCSVPVFLSSEKLLIVNNGIRKAKTNIVGKV